MAPLKVKRIRDESEYKSSGSSDFIGLDEGERFLGYALFEGDPKVDEPGFFPYKMHWNGKTSVPCADEGCPYCEDGDRPRSKAYTLWNVLEDEAGNQLGKNGEGELRIFDMPVTVIKQFNELRAEGESVKGRAFRVRRPDEKTYVVMPKTDKITAAAVKTLVKGDDAPDFEKMLTSKLKKAMEGKAVARALEDDEEDDRKSKAKKSTAKSSGKGKAQEEEPEADATWPDELEDAVVTVRSVDKKGDFFVAVSSEYDDEVKVYTTNDIEFDFSDLSKGDEVTISAELDGEGDYILTAEPEAGEPEAEEAKGGGDDLPDSIEDMEFVVVGTDESESTIEVKNDEMEFTLYLLDTVEVDFDDYPEDAKIIVSAEKDRAGDMVASEAPEVVKAKAAPKRKTAAKAAPKKAAAKSGKGK